VLNVIMVSPMTGSMRFPLLNVGLLIRRCMKALKLFEALVEHPSDRGTDYKEHHMDSSGHGHSN
jgi:hypothetical protein